MMNKGRFAVLTLKLACMSNRIISVIALLLIKSLICFGQLEDVLPPPEPDGRNVYYYMAMTVGDMSQKVGNRSRNC